MKEPEPKPVRLGRFQAQVVEAVVMLRADAYSAEIFRWLQGKGVKTDRGTICRALNTLERAQVLTSGWSEPIPQIGGRRRRVYALTILGEEAMRQRREASERRERRNGA